ncbi:MAG: CapA family protein [Bacteroidota bacterium]
MDIGQDFECQPDQVTLDPMNISRRFFFGLMLFVNICLLNGQDSLQNGYQFKLVFVGDIMGHGSQIEAAKVLKDSLYDYSPCFEYVSPILKQADLAVGNLEVTLPGDPPYKGYPQFRSPDDLALALRYAGFDLLVTANNHSNDARKKGVVNTIQTLHDYGFYHTGTFRNEEERSAFYPLIVYRNNFKLAFLNYTYGTNGIPTSAPTVVNLIDEAQMKSDLAQAKALSPDFIIVMMHWGLEYQLNESSKQRRLTDSLFTWGGDLVIGAHPHVVQPIKKVEYKRANQLDSGYVAFSLGNFISGQRKRYTDGGIMYELTLRKDELDQKARVINQNYIPVWRYIEKNGNKQTFRAIPISAFEEANGMGIELKTEDRQKMLFYLRETRKHLNRFDSSERKISLQELSTSKF